MSTPLDWSDAYLAQARVDLKGARAVQGVAPSVFAMLLQMVFEKLGKAALLRNQQMTVDQAQKTHRAAVTMLQALRRRPGISGQINLDALKNVVLPVVDALEKAQPAVARTNKTPELLEYPWESPAGLVQWPEAHLSIAKSLGDPRKPKLANRVLGFTEDLARRFDLFFERSP